MARLSELEAQLADLRAAGERWCRALDARPDGDQAGTLARAQLRLREVLGYPPGAFALGPVPIDEEAPGEGVLVERFRVLGYEVPSLNRRQHTHWSRLRRDRELIQLQLLQQLSLLDAAQGGAHRGRGKRMPRPIPRRCHLTIFRRRATIDEDNVIGGAKDLIDCIEAVGLIWEDSPLWFRPSFQVRSSDREVGPHVDLELWDIPNVTWTDAQQRAVARAADPAWVRKARSQALARLRRR